MIVRPNNTNSLIIKAITPISHGDPRLVIGGTNEQFFMTKRMFLQGKFIDIPSLSENALRNRLFRVPHANILYERLKIEKSSLPLAVVMLLENGGNMKDKMPSNVNDLSKKIRETFPHLSLLGGCVPSFILPRGDLKVVCFPMFLECRENILALCDDSQKDFLSSKITASYPDFVSETTRYKGNGGDEFKNREEQKIYSFQYLVAGTEFYIQLSFEFGTPSIVRSAARAALEYWDGFFGGRNSQGFGKFEIQSLDLPSSEEYFSYISENKNTLREHLLNGTLGTEKKICTDESKGEAHLKKGKRTIKIDEPES